MNLERVIPQNSNYMVLKKISEFSNKYLCIELEESSQKTNKGETITALDAKNIEQFKGKRRFFILEEKDIVSNIEKKGLKDEYKLNVYQGDLVSYNGLRYTVLGIIINTYAQWNIPTPFLFNISDIVKDYVGLYSSKLSDFEINELVNDNFQAGKYDNDMLIPLIDLYETNDDLKIIERRPSKTEVDFQIERYNLEKNLTLKAKKNIFIDTILANRIPEIDLIRQNDGELYESIKKLITSVNSSINKKIEKFDSKKKVQELDLISKEIELETLEQEAEDLFETKLKQTVDKKSTKETVEPKIELEEIPYSLEIKPIKVSDLPIQIQKLYLQRQKEAGNKLNLNEKILGSGEFDWDYTLEGREFWSYTTKGQFRLFREKYGKKGELVDSIVDADVLEYLNKQSKPSKETIEPKIELEELPGKSKVDIKFVYQLPIQIQKLYLQRQKEAGNIMDINIDVNNSKSSGGFDWVYTLEAKKLWENVSKGQFKLFKEVYGNKGERVDNIVDTEVLEYLNKQPKPTKETKATTLEEKEILKPGVKGVYGKKREKITILNITPKIVNFITEDGVKKGIYIESFLKNFIKE
jgi:hypothetical protein